MERHFSLVGAFAVLFFAVSAFSAGISGKKFCVGVTLENGLMGENLLRLSQRLASYEPVSSSDEETYTDYTEYCYDQWYDESVEEHYNQGSNSYTDIQSHLSVLLNEGHVALKLETDIDFGGMNRDSSCVATFKPLPSLLYSTFDGNGHAIKNLCYVLDGIDAEEYMGQSQIGIGFFAQATDGSFNNLNFENVYIRVNNYEPSYQVQVGAVVGRLGSVEFGSSIDNVSLKNVKIVGAVAGGLVGVVEGRAASVSNVKGVNVEVAALNGVVAQTIEEYNFAEYTGNLGIYLGGLVGAAKAGVKIFNAAITGLNVHSDVKKIELTPEVLDPEEDPSSASYYEELGGSVGGLVGTITGGAYSDEGVFILNTYTVGSISAPEQSSEDVYKVGFVVGAAAIDESYAAVVGNNYHYGESDDMARNVAGLLQWGEQDVTESWMYARDASSHVLGGGYNARNAIDQRIPASEGMDTVTYRVLVADLNCFGAYIEPRLMKKGAFAFILNGLLEDLSSREEFSASLLAWSRKDGVNGGLPVFETAGMKPIYQVLFIGSYEYYENMTAADKKNWTDAGAVEDAGGNIPLQLAIYTDYTGKLSNSTWQNYAATLAAGDYYWSYYDGNVGRNVAFKLTKTSTFNSSMQLNIEQKVTVTVMHGFVESTDGDFFYTPSEYALYMYGEGYKFYYLGTPATKISSDDAWTRVPYLGSFDQEYAEYRYYGFHFASKTCTVEKLDEPVEYCHYNDIQTLGHGNMYVDALSGLSNGDTLYVVYENEPMNTAGGYLYVNDLHGEWFDLDKATVTVKGEYAGERDTFGISENLQIQSSDSKLIAQNLPALVSTSGQALSKPYTPYLNAYYPPDFWNNVGEIVGLVIVGSTSEIEETVNGRLVAAAGELSSAGLKHEFLKDTVKSLESPAEIRQKMDLQISGHSPLIYACYVHMGKDGNIDLSNLFAALASIRENEDDYPVFVGFLPQLSDMTYHVTFDANYSDYKEYNPPFIASSWQNVESLDSTYTKENKDNVFFESWQWGVYRTDACYAGRWNFPPEAVYDNPDLTGMEGAYALKYFDDFPYETNKDGSRSLTLFAQWETDPEMAQELCYNRITWADGQIPTWNNYVVKDNSELGNIVLQQVWMGDTLRHKSVQQDVGVTGILVPYADTNKFVFEVFADGYAGYELEGDITFTKASFDGGTPETKKLKEGDLLTIDPWELMSSSMEFSANYTYKRFNIVFETGKTDVLYGENSDSVGTYKLNAEDDAIDLPFWVYTADQCVEGWTVHSNIENQDEPVMEGPDVNRNPDCNGEPNCEYEMPDNWAVAFDVFNFTLSEELDLQVGNHQEKYPLYAKWVDAKTCVEELSYKQTKLTESENGSVAFKEIRKDSTGKIIGTQLHKFAKDGTMLLPYYVKGSSFVVQGLPAKDYILDSLVMTLDGKKYVYHEGDTLAGSITKATFAAYFMPENPTPAKFVTSKLLQSGSAIRLEFATNEFGASGASVKVVLEDDDGKVVADSVIQISKTPYEGSWDYYPLRAGTYLLTATVANSKTSDVFEQDFEVKAEIASAAEGGWRMLSLSNVVMDSVTWDDDIRFYWWDDTRNTGAFWQYQRLNRDDKVDDLTGYWYSSLEGRPLVMKKDMAAPKDPVVWNMDSVYTGWNMVANPYGWYVDLYGENPNEKKAATEKSSIEFYSWNDSLGDYEPVDVIGPYEAVWAKVTGPSLWKLPSRPAFVATVDAEGEENVVEPLKKTVELASGGKGWAIRAVLRDAKGKRDSWNFMGVSESGWASEEPPSGMGDHVNLSIKDGNKSLAKSFKKAAGDSYEWTVSLEASGDRTGYLHFEGVRDLNAAGLKVFVTVDGTTTQMAENDTLKVSIGSMAKTATVRVAPSARTVVAQKLNGLRAFQAGNSLQVGFQVSESLAGARAYVEILDMKGKVLSSVSGTAVSGSNALTLQTPKSGLYMVRVRVGSKQAAGSVAIK